VPDTTSATIPTTTTTTAAAAAANTTAYLNYSTQSFTEFLYLILFWK